MPRVALGSPVPLAVIAVLVACSAEPPTQVQDRAAQPADVSFAGWEWSPPVNLGAPINTNVADANPVLSPDGLSLYYDSDRSDLPGANGARDIWVSRRSCDDAADDRCAWQTPVNLGPTINTPYVDGSPEISDDGHLLFFISHAPRDNCPLDPVEADPTRPCDEDIYVSWRANKNDDLGWGPPVRLGEGVNSSDGDNEPAWLPNAEPGQGNLYFSRSIGGVASGFDIFVAGIRLTRRGNSSGLEVTTTMAAMPVVELNVPNALDAGPSLRADGREIFFYGAAGGRPGAQGGLDLWTATRQSPGDSWSPPVNLGAPMNFPMADLAPSLSRDGRTLFFTSNRQGPAGFVGWDIYMSTRMPDGS